MSKHIIQIERNVRMELTEKTIVELRQIAKEKGLKGISAMRKSQLIEVLSEVLKAEQKTAPKRKKRETPAEPKPAAKRNQAEESKPSEEKRPIEAKRPTEYRGLSEEKGPTEAKRPTEYRGLSEEKGLTEDKKPTEYRGSAEERRPMEDRRRYDDRRSSEDRSDQRTDQRNYESRFQRKNNFHPGSTNNNVQQNSNYYSYHNAKKLLYHDGSDGLVSIMKERQLVDVHPSEMKELDSGITKNGILEVMAEGYGFIRCDNFLPGENDVYVAPLFIKRFGLRTGDIIEGNLRIRAQSEKFSALLYMKKVNGRPPSYLYTRKRFEDLTPVFPDDRIHLETPGASVSMRMLDLISPIGKGQRGMIVSQPKTGKTTLLKQVARAVTGNYPDMHLIILLIDERPEEVTDIRESIEGNNVEVIYSTFDELPDNHRRVSEMVIERAKRLAESGEDVVILLDSITRLARAYNLTVTPSGRTLSGGLDPAALHMPKRFFGAARNMREGGSLTILATALVDTGSRMDDVVFEEFKGTGNMELVLDRSLSEKRIFPAIDIQKSSTRREDLLLSEDEQEAVLKIRRALSGLKSEQAMEQILDLFRRTKNNVEFVNMVKKMHL